MLVMVVFHLKNLWSYHQVLSESNSGVSPEIDAQWMRCSLCQQWRRPPAGTFETFNNGESTFDCSIVGARCRLLKRSRQQSFA